VIQGKKKKKGHIPLSVCVCGRKAHLVSECPLDSPPVEGESPEVVETPLVEEEASFQNTRKSWKKQQYGYRSRRDSKSRLTVLVEASSNLPDRPA
jgi:hypothetical protein